MCPRALARFERGTCSRGRGFPGPGERTLLAGARAQARATRDSEDVDELAASAVAEPDDTVDGGEQGVVAAATHVVAGMESGATLAHDDRAGAHVRPGRDLHAQSLRRGVTPVPRGRGALLLRHAR